MPGYETIAFEQPDCDGCGLCMRACALAKTGGEDVAHARIRIVPGEAEGTFELAICRQCGDPKCVQECPAAALWKDGDTGVIGWSREKCVDCLLCTVGCAWSGIVWDAAAAQVIKCDLCGGAPACVAACPHDALKHVTAAWFDNRVGDLEDLFVPGLARGQGCIPSC